MGTERRHDGCIHGQHGVLLPRQRRHGDGDDRLDGETRRGAVALRPTQRRRRRTVVQRRFVTVASTSCM